MKRAVLGRGMLVLALGVALVLCLGALGAGAQGKGGGKGNGGTTVVANGPLATVTIKVVAYYGGAPISGVHVGLYNDATTYKGSGQTDDAGCITFTDVPYSDPNYRAAIDKGGFRDSIRLVPVTSDAVSVTLIMYPR